MSKNTLDKPTVRESILYRRLRGEKVQCLTCYRKCVIAERETGFCKTRVNVGGRLYTIIYGDISSISNNPIEKKPLFHFYPGTYALTVGSWSCNFTCPWCQNYEISKIPPDLEHANYIPPEKLVEYAVKYSSGTSISFNEPTLLLEYSLDVFRLASEKGLYNTYITNGYMTLEALKLLIKSGLNAMNIDVKGLEHVYRRYCGISDWIKVLENAKFAIENGVHVELTNLVITNVNDREENIEELVEHILKYCGDKAIIHFTRYFPAYMFHEKPTKIETLEKAYKIAKRAGVKYVYIGNVPGHRYEHTYCHNCGKVLIKRHIFSIIENRIKNGRCPYCGAEIYGVW
ncbi:AmmeMemoRadiSam system radical SAM enzyme [archaeon]|nr:MAG: AmmeMemoRadiSam system radical SAM enzyme [archaeon]RLG65656.1 MAG: AmmeMemoRadiSam system radical SAM enzyme [archaeon]RLG66376.1 MAG: AmmeMemoRadiSam system radical SAM enzyme [archaeon]HDM23953.1 AmmeMemoRadiSam system radical SAM enzyme [Candidatus Bathyarchaeota archaeon]